MNTALPAGRPEPKGLHQIAGRLVDVINGDIYPALLTMDNGQILRIERVAEAPRQYLLPGLIDAHIHIESSLLTPRRFAEQAVLHGTTAVVTNPHEIANVAGMEGIDYMIRDAEGVPLRFYFTAPSCVPSTKMETSGAVIGQEQIREMLMQEDFVALGEVMDYGGVLNGDPDILAKMEIARQLGKPIDGHCPGLGGKDLDHYIKAGISTDHESISLEEAEEKHRKGVTVMVREGSASRDLQMLMPFARRNPHFLVTDDLQAIDLMQGHLDSLLRRSVKGGVDPIDAIRAATLWPAEHYDLRGGRLQVGEVGDVVVVSDLTEFKVSETWIGGRPVAIDGVRRFNSSPTALSYKLPRLAVMAAELRLAATAGTALVRVIEVAPDRVISRSGEAGLAVIGGCIAPDPSRDVLLAAVVNRYVKARPSLAFIRGFGLRSGALASSVAHDSHNIIAVGTSPEHLARAINGVFGMGGGLYAFNGARSMSLELPIGGLMSDEPCEVVARKEFEMARFVNDMGCPLPAPFVTLSFQSLLVVPELKLGDMGLYDSAHGRFVDPVIA